MAASSNFRQLGLQPGERVPRLTALAQLSHSFGRRISVSGGYLRREGRSRLGMPNDPDVVDFSGVNSSLNWQLTRKATLVAAFKLCSWFAE